MTTTGKIALFVGGALIALGGFIRLAFAETAFAFVGEAIPELDMVSCKKRVPREYRAIVERTPGSQR